jgi:hypothetical protein
MRARGQQLAMGSKRGQWSARIESTIAPPWQVPTRVGGSNGVSKGQQTTQNKPLI